MALVSRLSVTVAIVIALALGIAASASSRPADSDHRATFPCHSSWTLNQGEPPGQVVAGFGVNCAGLRRAESLTVTGRLFKLNTRTGKWHLEQTRTAHWANLSRTRSLNLRRPCAAAPFRASFSAVLRYPGGAVAGKVTIDSGRLQVVVPCVF